MNYEEALDRAEKTLFYLKPFCSRIEIAGSIRRKKQTEIKDVEIVAKPIIDKQQTAVDCFGGAVFNETDMLGIRIQQLISEGIFGHGEPDKSGKRAPAGPRYYRLTYDGEKLDVFAVLPPADFGTVYLIRTGSAEFSQWFVTRLHDFNLHSIDGHIEEYGTGKIFPTPDEADCFRLIHQDFIQPENRTLEAMKGIII